MTECSGLPSVILILSFLHELLLFLPDYSFSVFAGLREGMLQFRGSSASSPLR